MKVTSVLYMAELEPSIEFWTKRIGFEVTVSVPDGSKVGFVILQKGDAEVMLQSHSSAQNDVPGLADFCRQAKTALFVEVEDFNDILKRVEGLPVALPVRKTFYGMTEVGLFEPGGNLVVFGARIS